MKYFLTTIIGLIASATAVAAVPTESGLVAGVETGAENVTVYRGIPYAAPPTGELRWQKPRPAAKWDGVRICDRFGDACLQPGSAEGTFYWKEFFEGDTTRFSENCLTLNIWVPTDLPARPMPVAVWIHGGAYINGYGHEKEFDGEAYVRRGVILVTINYRLGIWGFLAHPDLACDGNGAGNYGLWDQLAAIRWVKDNIASFGGDPDRITVMGQSAGAGSVQALISSPLSRGLISKAIIQSGGGLKGIISPGKHSDAEIAWKRFTDSIGINGIDDLRQIPADSLTRLADRYAAASGPLPVSPVIDGSLIETDFNTTALAGRQLDIPYMIGYTSDDINPEAMRRAATQWSLLLEKQGRRPAYVYCFSRDLPGEDMKGEELAGAFGDMKGAFHSSELWYMFGTLDRSWRPMTDADRRLSDKMLDYWTNFIKTGSPDGEGLPRWEPFTADNQEILVLDEDDISLQQ